MYKQIVVRTENFVTHVTLHRPEVHNAFHPDMIAEITKIFKSIQKDKNVRAVLLSGSGKGFCAGADLGWMKSMAKYSLAENKKDAGKLYDMFASIRDCGVPVVGKVHGAVMGGALGLLSVCDVVFAEKNTSFSFSEVRLGLAPAVISTFVEKRMRRSDMHRYFLTGSKFLAEEAKAAGLVHVVVEGEESLNQVTNAFINDELLVAGPQALRETKKLLNALDGFSTEAKAKSATTNLIAKMRVSKEGQEGLTSFFEKRKANWRLS